MPIANDLDSTRQQRLRARTRAVLGDMRNRSRWWIVGTVAAVLVIVALFPQIVASTPLGDRIVQSAFADLNGDVTVGSLSLGWFSKPALQDVEVADSQGRRVAIVPEITVDQSLWSLLSNSSRLGRVRLERPEVVVEVTEEGSNLEDLLAPLLESSEEATLDCPELSLDVEDGRVLIYDARTKQEWKLEAVSAKVTLGEDWSAPLHVDCTAVAPLGDRESPITAEAVVERSLGSDGAVNSKGRVALRGEEIPLDMLQPLAERAVPGLQMAGRMTSNVRYEWVSEAGLSSRALVEGNLQGKNLMLAAPALGKDIVRLESWRLPCRMVRSGDQVTVERLALECDIGRCELLGPLTVRLDGDLARETAAALVNDAYQIDGNVDLARLAALLPETLRIREGTQITSGALELDLAHKSSEEGSIWEGTAEVSSLEAQKQGKRLSWKKPVQITIAARDGADGPVIDRLLWQSSFLELEAQGTMDLIEASATLKLSELARQLGQFVDLGTMQLAGDGWSHIVWKRGDNGRFDVSGECQLSNLSLGTAGGQLWTEEQLDITLVSVGQSEGRAVRRVDSGNVKLESGSDTATVKLLKPVVDPTRTSDWNLDVQASGQLATWLARLEPWVGALEGWRLAGTGTVEGRVVASADRLKINPVTLTLGQFQATGHGLYLNEPALELKGGGEWDGAAGRLHLPDLQLISEAVTARAQELVCEAPEGRFSQLRGKLAWNGDLARLQSWFANPEAPPAWTAAGAIAGRMDFNKNGQATTGKVIAALDDLELTDARGRKWSEQRVDLSADGKFDTAKDLLSLERLLVEGDSLRCDAKGQVAEMHGRRNVDLRGKFDYDTEKLMQLLRPWLGETVLVEARREPREFTLVGPLRANPVDQPLGRPRSRRPSTLPGESLTAQAGVGWTGANVYGFLVGPGEVPLHYAAGVLETGPVDLAVSDGRLATQPQLILSPGPAELVIPKGLVLDKVRVNRDMTFTWLQYMLPVLAEVAEAEGVFSMDVDEWHIAVASPGTADISGRLTIDTMQVEAGPLMQEVVFVVDTVRRLITKKPLRSPGAGLPPVNLKQQSVVPFRMVEGRIYHKDLILTFDDVTLRTYGSVGLDKTISLMVELPIPDKWIGNGAGSSGLRGQVIQLPIGGTLAEPVVDEQALKQVTTQLAQRGAQGLILEGVNRGLDKLLNPQR